MFLTNNNGETGLWNSPGPLPPKDGTKRPAARRRPQERRKLAFVSRETPLHMGHLRHMIAVAEMGAIILPPAPSLYHGPRTIMGVVDQTVGRVLDQFNVPHNLFRRWAGDDP